MPADPGLHFGHGIYDDHDFLPGVARVEVVGFLGEESAVTAALPRDQKTMKSKLVIAVPESMVANRIAPEPPPLPSAS